MVEEGRAGVVEGARYEGAGPEGGLGGLGAGDVTEDQGDDFGR